MNPYGIASVYSPRKFFGVSDGGIVYCNKKLDVDFERDYSWNRFSHLLKRADVNSNFGYSDFNKNEETLDHEEIKTISRNCYQESKKYNIDELLKPLLINLEN